MAPVQVNGLVISHRKDLEVLVARSVCWSTCPSYRLAMNNSYGRQHEKLPPLAD